MSTTAARTGDDVAACSDADCRIRLSTDTAVPLDAAFGIQELLLAPVAPDRVISDVGSRRGDVHGYIRGTGYVGLAYGVTITVETVDTTGAPVRIEPGQWTHNGTRAAERTASPSTAGALRACIEVG